MSSLPLSVRLSLWGTCALAGRVGVDRAVQCATPDLDEIGDLAGHVRMWGDLGERVVLPALPGPGDLGLLPRNDGSLTGSAVEAGECVYVPGIGSALVPDLQEYGPAGDTGWLLLLETHSCEPVPRHRLEMLSIRDADRELHAAVAGATDTLQRLGAVWGEGQRALADAAVGGDTWGLPAGLDRGTARTITRAATLATITRLATTAPDPALTAADAVERERALRMLGRAADRALEQAATIACLQTAGWLPVRE